MRKQSHFRSGIIFLLLLFAISESVHAQNYEINNAVVSYKKHELKSGFILGFGKEREELRTDDTRFYEENSVFKGTYKIENSNWNLLDYKQEKLNFSFDLGPMVASGSWIDSLKINNTEANHSLYGLRAAADVHFQNRFYYDPKSYSLVDVRASGQYNLYNQNSKGTVIDSFSTATDLDKNEFKNNLRLGIEAKAGFGFGRLSPMNHLMVAHYLLEKYYPGRLFSDIEIAHFAQQIAELKNDRDFRTLRNTDQEITNLASFVREQMLLESPESMGAEWQFGEFDPRFEGTRLEMGPFFKYYNHEPDFVYGGFISLDIAKYQNVKWNRNIGINLKYNRYKEQDWMLAELNVGWTYYSGLRSQFDFGIKYVPGIEIDGFENAGTLSHNLIPYFAWYSQVNTHSRVRFDFAWRIADGEQFVVPGPEFTLAFYRSRY